jgi:hypothetical protein
VTPFSDFRFASLIPLPAALFPATARRGLQIIDGRSTGHFPAGIAASGLILRNTRWSGAKEALS